MQNAAFAARGLDWAYVALDVAPEDLEDALRGLVALGFAGANVTIPHKRAVAELCDELDRAATRAVSVNTLVFRDGRILGSSTDGLGRRRGGGGARRPGARPRRRRRRPRGGRCARGRRRRVRVATRRDPDWPPRETDATLLVNATPLVDEVPVEPRPGQTVVDLAYRPDGSETALVAAARRAGCVVVDGLEVLVRQGAASFRAWTEHRRAARGHARRRQAPGREAARGPLQTSPRSA